MAKKNIWSDEYWVLLMQIYMQKPVGMKTLRSKELVNLALELNIDPVLLHEKMLQLNTHDTPSLQKLWSTYATNTRRLNRDAKNIRQMVGFGDADLFYDGVEKVSPINNIFAPISPDTNVSPAMLILILKLYFSLTPGTMVETTPEVTELSKVIGLSETEVVEVMRVFQTFDPILRRDPAPSSPLNDEIKRTWDKFYRYDSSLHLDSQAEKIRKYYE